MLSKQEELFIQYWEKERELIAKQGFWQAIKNTPRFLKFSLLIPALYLISYQFNQEWFQIQKAGNAETGIRNPYFDNPLIIFSVLAGSIIIAIFVSYFTRQHKNEMNEQYYKELTIKKKKAENK